MRFLMIGGLVLVLAACSGLRVRSPDEFCAECQAESPYEKQLATSQTSQRQFQRGEDTGGLFSISLFRNQLGRGGGNTGGGGSGIGVNSHLWRASLDTLSFIPLSTADPFGGVIISDWYVPPEVTDERFKVSVFILDTQLRADGVRATVFKQTLNPNGGWIDAEVSRDVSAQLEDAILTRAREIRVNGG
ncbi:MAG: DUF3576 domain-containing protein [Alphaproteobacteria bacterium]|nr:DUF3576 domain-containing protein [Alphaproteobacteria bacterium]